MEYIGKTDIKLHLFVCVNDRSKIPEPKNPDCASFVDQKEIKDLKNQIKEKNLGNDIKITKTYCLGGCSKGGFICLVYPDKSYYLLKDVKELKDLIKEKADINL